MSHLLREETLDPENWDEFKLFGNKIMEEALTHLQNIRDHSNTQQPKEALQKLLVPLSEKGEGEEHVYKILSENHFPYHLYCTRPEFWGFVAGTGSPYGVLVDTLISTRNAGAIAMGDLPLHKQTIDWIKELLEIPTDYSGVFVSGGSEANYTGLAVARNAKAEVDMKTKGMQRIKKKMVLYGSEEIHHCLERSVELLGIGSEAIRWIPVDHNYKIKLDSLKEAIKKDKKRGLNPFCIIGNAGTVNTGAFDNLNALADICQSENIWFHIDGAFGAWVKLSKTHKQLADGLERGDSIAIDLHKWMDMPYPIGLTLVREKTAHYRTFVYGHEAKYYDSIVGNVDLDTMTLISSLALSRGNTGLKAYMLLRAYGKEKYHKLVQQNIDQINYLAELVRKEPNLEITIPVVSNIVCFRYIHDGLNASDLEGINRVILGELWKINWGMISDTTIKGKYMLRACNVNHRSKYPDFNILVERITTIGNIIAKEYL